jgi:sigma-B regulation protein RsbU (phosphoserine phosphatase)
VNDAPDERSANPVVLIVDDTPENLTIMNGLLKDAYRTRVANSGERALKLAAAEPKPDLVLLDIMMPGMDGYEVCRRLKADAATHEIPVIFLTAKTQVEDESRGFEVGCVDYITKPISPPIVLARVRTHLALKAAADFLRDKNEYLAAEVARRVRDLEAATRARQRVETELEVAHRIQMDMLPTGGSQDPELYDLAARLVPARAVGGDLYDYFHLGSKLYFLVGDVSGKGVPAALFMARVKTLFATVARHEPDLSRVLADVNRGLCADNDAAMFATLYAGTVDLDTGEVHCAAGGHEPPILIPASGEAARIVPADGGPALGLQPEAAFPTMLYGLQPGDALVLYTDGVTEAESEQGGFFTDQRLLELLSGAQKVSAAAIADRVLSAVREFAGKASQSDDITVLTLRYRPATAHATATSDLKEPR